ncbi:MAG TPA: hypothetical protein VF061_03615 [Gemmatimonadales bacterium]
MLRIGEPGHDHGELVPAESGDLGIHRGPGRTDLILALAARGPQPPRHLLEQVVPRFMAQGVVDPAEMVEIDEERRQSGVIALGLLQGAGEALLVGKAVGEAGETVVVREGADLLQHPGVHQRDGRLIREPPDLHPCVGDRRLLGVVGQHDHAHQLSVEPQREHETPGVAPLHQGRDERRRRLAGGGHDGQCAGSVEQLLHVLRSKVHPHAVTAAEPVVVDQAGQRLGPVRRHERDAHRLAGVDVAKAREERGDDVSDTGGREHRPIDLGGGRERLELAVELGGHGIEGGTQVLELVPATDLDPAAEVPARDPPGAFSQLGERYEAAPDPADAQHHDECHGGEHDECQLLREAHDGAHDMGPRLPQGEVPGRRGEDFVQEDGPGRGHVGLDFEGCDGVGRQRRVEPQGLEAGLDARDRADEDVSAVVLHRQDGAGGDQALIEGRPEVVGIDLTDEETAHALTIGAFAHPADQVGAGEPSLTMVHRDERKTVLEIAAGLLSERGMAVRRA